MHYSATYVKFNSTSLISGNTNNARTVSCVGWERWKSKLTPPHAQTQIFEVKRTTTTSLLEISDAYCATETRYPIHPLFSVY